MLCADWDPVGSLLRRASRSRGWDQRGGWGCADFARALFHGGRGAGYHRGTGTGSRLRPGPSSGEERSARDCLGEPRFWVREHSPRRSPFSSVLLASAFTGPLSCPEWPPRPHLTRVRGSRIWGSEFQITWRESSSRPPPPSLDLFQTFASFRSALPPRQQRSCNALLRPPLSRFVQPLPLP